MNGFKFFLQKIVKDNNYIVWGYLRGWVGKICAIKTSTNSSFLKIICN